MVDNLGFILKTFGNRSFSRPANGIRDDISNYIARTPDGHNLNGTMGLFKTRKPYSSSVRVLRLTDARVAVVSRRPTRNLFWAIVSLPVRIFMGFWNWVMESKPSGYPRYRR